MRVEEERMKESWMDKLIELLNEYWKWYFELDDEWWIVDGNQDTLAVTSSYITMQIISKKYWFIQRLVDNHKIDFSWEWELSLDLVNLFERKVDNADWVIALLSISDTPIEDLVSYLK